MLKSVLIESLDPNPWRRLDEYPLIHVKIAALKESIAQTGFWGTIVARPQDDGRYEIAFGHHRRVALQELFAERCPKVKSQVQIIVRDLTNEEMIQMMARENMEEWGTSAWVELETVRSTIEAAEKGEIVLPRIPARTDPGVIRPCKSNCMVKYTKATVATFLGWTVDSDHGTKRPNFACETAFRALDMIEAGIISEDDVRGLTRVQMNEVVGNAAKIHRGEMDLAEYNREESERARAKAEVAPTSVERQRLEKQATVYAEQADEHEAAAVSKQREFGKEAADLFREGKGIRDVRGKADQLRPASPRAAKVHNVDELADRISAKLHRIANDDDDLSGDVVLLKQCRGDLSSRAAASLCQSFTSLIGRLERMRGAFKTSL